MKNSVLWLLVLLPLLPLQAQQQTMDDFENRKSGNYKEILNSFYQLTTKNLTGPEKSISFNSTLFAIKAGADPDLYIDRNFVNERFSRDLQFNFRVNMDQAFSYTGLTAGFTYAIVNQRDRKLVQFKQDTINIAYNKIFADMDMYVQQYTKAVVAANATDPDAIAQALNGLQDSVNAFLNNEDIATLPPGFRKFLEQKGTIKTLTAFNALKNEYYAKVDKAVLWTLYADGSANKDGKLTRGTIGSTFLKGDFVGDGELDIRALFTYGDTIASPDIARQMLNSTIGMNFSILKAKASQKSLLEIKAYAEYTKVFRNPLPDEKEDTLLANADFRIRIWDDFWIPLTIKYDIEEANFLGFLNITYNFEQFK